MDGLDELLCSHDIRLATRGAPGARGEGASNPELLSDAFEVCRPTPLLLEVDGRRLAPLTFGDDICDTVPVGVGAALAVSLGKGI